MFDTSAAGGDSEWIIVLAFGALPDAWKRVLEGGSGDVGGPLVLTPHVSVFL